MEVLLVVTLVIKQEQLVVGVPQLGGGLVWLSAGGRQHWQTVTFLLSIVWFTHEQLVLFKVMFLLT
jgi:hypothetical protein